jgi:predicted ribosome quality control (RQC) complex YloA/Tae2 family protein
MDAAILTAVLPEIREALEGLVVTKVECTGKYGVLLHFQGERSPLLLTAHPELSRIGLLGAPPVQRPRRAPDALAEPLLRATLERLEQEPNGRVVRLCFTNEGRRHPRLELVGELIPRFANIVLVGNDELILWARREFVGPGRPRQVAPGERYLRPAGRTAPSEAGELPDWATLADASVNEAVDRHYRPLEEVDAREIFEAEVRRTLVRRRARAAKALRAIEARLADADLEPDLRHHAELLAAHLGSVKKGMESIRLPDFDDECEVEIQLDRKLDPHANLEALFRRARRLARGRADLESQRSIQQEEIATAERGLTAIETAAGLADLEQVAEERGLAPSNRAAGGRAPSGAAATAAPDLPPGAEVLPDGFNPRRYFLAGGWEVWVGRSAHQNDELTHRYAAPRDLWFHARGCQGSHTLLRISSGKGEPSKETIRQAAAIAAFHSKARTSGLVPVAYAERRYVRKPRKSPSGTAAMLREKVIFVEPWAPEGIGEGRRAGELRADEAEEEV